MAGWEERFGNYVERLGDVRGPRPLVGGWAAYFGYGTRLTAYRAVDNHVYDRVRHFLVRRHKVPSRGTRRYPDRVVFGDLGVLRLRRVHLDALPSASR